MSRKFNFDLYRLNIVDVYGLFISEDTPRIRSDGKLLEFLEASSVHSFDQEQKTRGAVYKWSVRDFSEYQKEFSPRRVASIILARSVIAKDGLIVTDEGISSGSSSPMPPLASTMILFFDFDRHLVAVEHSGELSQTAWKDHLEKIFSSVALSRGLGSSIELEPVPEFHRIINLFKSFDRVTRIKATLRLPNPELTRYTKSLYDDLRQSDVREYTQDMKNPSGLSQSEDARPFATIALADQGYKHGDVHLEGFKGERYEKVVSGSDASRGSINSLKDFVRGLHANARTKETAKVLKEITREIDRIQPRGALVEND